MLSTQGLLWQVPRPLSKKNARYKLAKYGGHINITKYFAVSLLRRMGFVKRKGTKSVKQLPADFDEIKKNYVEKVSNVVTKFQIPDSLIINWDQTGCQLIPEETGLWIREGRNK